MPVSPPRSVPHLLADLWTRPAVRLLAYVVLGALLALLLRRLSGVLVAVGVAYGLAYLINPALAWLERRGLGRGWGVLVLTLLGAGLTALLFWRLAAQVTDFIVGLPALAERLSALLDRAASAQNDVPGVDTLQTRVAEYIRTRALELARDVGPLLDRVVTASPAVLAGWLGALGQAGLVVTLALYFAVDYRRVGERVLAAFPRDWQPTVRRLSEDVGVSFGAVVRGNVLVALAVGTLAALGLALLRVPNALALGLLTAALWPLPFVGIVLATVPALLQAIPQGTATVALVAGLYFLLNQTGGNLLGPLIMGRTTQLPAWALLTAVLVGFALAGALGALLAGPVALLLSRWAVRYWWPSRLYRGRAEPEPQRPLP